VRRVITNLLQLIIFKPENSKISQADAEPSDTSGMLRISGEVAFDPEHTKKLRNDSASALVDPISAECAAP